MGWSVDEIRNFYRSFAEKYDEDLSNYTAPSLLAGWIINHLQPAEGQTLKIIDVGCGTGQSAAPFLKHKFNNLFEIYGVDASQEMLQRAEKLNLFKQLVCMDIELLPENFTKNTFNAVICAGVLDFVRNVPSLFQKFFDLLVTDDQNCCVAMTIPETKSNDLNAYSFEEILELVDISGFSILKCGTILGYIDSETQLPVKYWAILMNRKF